PGPADVTARERRLLAEIPSNFTELQAADPELALEWRMSTRAVFRHYLARGYRVVDFFLSAEAGRGQYLLALRE
ncbi:MAG: GNAT family N-acetyltransferase, partial [Vicinamibacterales bacterium]